MALGAIGSVIEDLRFGSGYWDSGQIVHISGTVYTIFCSNEDADGEIRTYNIGDDGDIGSLIATAEWDGDSAIEPAVLRISGSVYAVLYRGPSLDTSYNTLKLATITINDAGAISSVIETLVVGAGQTYNALRPRFIHVSGTVYAALYHTSGGEDKTRLATVNIDNDGTNLSVVDSAIIEGTNGYWGDIIYVAGTIYAIAHHVVGGTEQLKTLDITTTGTIGSVLDTLDLGRDTNTPVLLKVATGIFAIVHGITSYIETFSVDGVGDITLVDETIISGASSTEAIVIHRDNSTIVIATAFRSSTFKPVVRTYPISVAGTIGAQIDSLTITNNSASGPSLLYLAGNNYAITYLYSTGSYAHLTTFDIETLVSPTVTTQACTNTIAEQSIGHGTLTEKGSSDITQHGHCWSTSSGPTTADSKTENGAAPNLGQFTSDITGLTPGTTYYVRAYATNSEGTSYGDDVEITTLGVIGRRHWWTEDTAFHYFDQFGVERKAEGTTVTSVPPDALFPIYH